MTDFKGYKYALVTMDGEVISLENDHSQAYIDWKQDMNAEALLENPNYKEEIKQVESIYTQEMRDIHELPEIGMLFIDGYTNDKCEVIGVCLGSKGSVNRNEGYVITFKRPNFNIDCKYFTEYVLPIDTRTQAQKDKEMAIESLAYVMENGFGPSTKDNAEMIIDSMIASEFEYLKYTGEK